MLMEYAYFVMKRWKTGNIFGIIILQEDLSNRHWEDLLQNSKDIRGSNKNSWRMFQNFEIKNLHNIRLNKIKICKKNIPHYFFMLSFSPVPESIRKEIEWTKNWTTFQRHCGLIILSCLHFPLSLSAHHGDIRVDNFPMTLNTNVAWILLKFNAPI